MWRLNRGFGPWAVAIGLLFICLAHDTHAKEQYAPAVPRPTLSEVAYGEHPRQVMDFWKAEGQGPRPLAFIIHGGGWRGGSKERAQRFADVQRLLDAGISVAAINYRLIEGRFTDNTPIDTSKKPPVHMPLIDAARALQFVRSKSEAWNIDKTRIGAAGGSAGACSSLWLLYHDDLADPKSDDPVARESTRLACAAVVGAQTCLDPKLVKEWMPNSRYGGHAFGQKNFASLLAAREQIMPWINEYSPYHLVSKDDPPAYLIYNNKPAMGKDTRDPTHSANFGVKLKERCEAAGLNCELKYPGAPDVVHEDTTAFLIARLTAR